MTQYDVIVVGAGLSGLQAAHDIQQAHLSCLVLEARDRVGGKLWSVPVNGGRGTIELGGAWINDVNQPRAIALARKLGLEMISQNVVGDCILEGHGRFPYGADPPIPEADRNLLILVRDKMESLCHAIDLSKPAIEHQKYDGMSVDALAVSLGATALVRGIVNIWTSAMLGFGSTHVGALYFLDYCRLGGGLLRMRSDAQGGGQHLRFRTGAQSLATGLAASLEKGTIVYSAAVSHINQTSAGGCAVSTRDGRLFRSKKVVSSIPSPLLRDITMSPHLSAAKTWISNTSELGFYAKVFLKYDTPWWRQRGLCGLAQGLHGPVSLTRDTSSDRDDMYTLLCFVVGDSGRSWSKKSQEERTADVLNHVDTMYGQTCPRPLSTTEKIWNSEEFSRGAPCPVIPISSVRSLCHGQWYPEGHLHFCGTETSPIWKGYMEGALTSGARVAQEVIEEFNSRSVRSAKL